MNALVYDTNHKLRLEDRPYPSPGQREATIAVSITAICGTDLRTYRYGSSRITPPRILGHEVVGRIVETGAELELFHEDDLIHIAPAIGCGECYYCRIGHSNLCDRLETIGFQHDGSFAEYMRVPEQAFKAGNVTKIEQSENADALVLSEPLGCVVNAQEFIPIEGTETMAVYGGGFIGCLHAALALSKGVPNVIVIEVDDNRAAAVHEALPEVSVMNSRKIDLTEELRKRTEGRGVDASIVACSVGPVQTEALQNTRKLGHVSLFGGLPGESNGFLDSNVIHYNEISIHGVHAASPRHNRIAMQLIKEGRINIAPFVRDVFSLDDIMGAFKAVDQQEVLKALIRPA